MTRVWVELAPGGLGQAIRIFRHAKAAYASPAWDDLRVALVDRAKATRDIRQAVFLRDNYTCTHCGAVVNWGSGEMHERQHRGRGGEMSLENSTTLCRTCHRDSIVAGHGKRKPQFKS